MHLTLYFAPGTVSLAALIALEEANAEFDAVRLDLAKNEQRSPGFLALNARGQVPVLVVDNQVITENIAVLTFIAHQYPNARLLPSNDPIELARVYQFLSWFVTNPCVAVGQIARSARFADTPEAQADVRASGLPRFEATLVDIDRAASEGPPFGDAFSIAHPLALVAWRWAERLGVDLSPYAAWRDLVDRLKARPSVIRAFERELVV